MFVCFDYEYTVAFNMNLSQKPKRYLICELYNMKKNLKFWIQFAV